MTKVGLISDTHGHIDQSILNFLKDCQQIWHAGDIGSFTVTDTLKKICPIVAVHGNIDDAKIKTEFPQIQKFTCENTLILMTHIGGYPGKYESKTRELIKSIKPNAMICGHSHILKVIYDQKYDLLHLNPGAAGVQGFHNVRTALKFCIDGKNFSDMQILEITRNK